MLLTNADSTLSSFERGYAVALAQDLLYNAFLTAYHQARAKNPNLTKEYTAKRTGIGVAQIDSYFSSPGNWNLRAFALLCAALNFKPTITLESRVAD